MGETVLPVFRRTVADSWRSLIAWSLGVAAALFMYLPLFPSIGGNGQMQQVIDSLPQELVKTLGYEQIASGPGYVQGTFFGLIGFLLLTIAATSWGSGAIAGAEESGRLELTLAHAVGRGAYVLEAALAVLVRLLILASVAGVIILALDGPSELDLRAAHVLAGLLSLTGLAFLSGMLALFVGALTGRRVLATASGAGIAVAGYIVNAIGNQIDDGEMLRRLSPYGWAYGNHPLTEGADAGGLSLLWGCSALLLLAAALVLRRRDITG